MASDYAEAKAVEMVAQSILAAQHPHLVTAKIAYMFIDRVPSKGGREVFGKAVKVSGRWAHMTELDFILEVSLPKWNDFNPDQRHALVDHLLQSCHGDEQEDGSMKWSLREPDVQEFSSILQRHGIWHEGLTDFCTVAQQVDLATIVQQTTGEVVEESDELDLNELDV